MKVDGYFYFYVFAMVYGFVDFLCGGGMVLYCAYLFVYLFLLIDFVFVNGGGGGFKWDNSHVADLRWIIIFFFMKRFSP